MSDTTSTGRAWIVTGPTSGIGRRTAHRVATHGKVVLVGRSPEKLRDVKAEIEARPGGHAVTVVADLSDPARAREAAEEIAALDLPLAGLLNNAGVMVMREGATTGRGWDLAFATNHLGPFAFTDALVPHLPDGANVVFICSAVEDPERTPATMAGYRGGRYLSAEASARGEWQPGGSTRTGYDAYATSKQCNLATVYAFARAYPRLRFNGIEPGVIPSTGLGRDAGPALRFVARYVISPLAPLIPHFSTAQAASRMITGVLTSSATGTAGYVDEKGRPLQASTQVRDPGFQDRVVAETRAFLAAAG